MVYYTKFKSGTIHKTRINSKGNVTVILKRGKSSRNRIVTKLSESVKRVRFERLERRYIQKMEATPNA